MIQPVRIGRHVVGPGQPCFIIAEAGVNHNGDMDLAYRLVDAAIVSNADAIKFQSFITEELITPNAPKARYQVQTTGDPSSQYKMLKTLELNFKQQEQLMRYCQRAGILFLSTPYDYSSVDFLDKMNIPAFKIASTDTNNIPFLGYAASKGRPVILSTGMSTLSEIEQAVFALCEHGLTKQFILLQCTSEYPAPIEEVNLKAIQTLQRAFGCPVGFSDHTPGLLTGPWAVAIGACVVEKHFTLDRSMKGPDHRASIEPQELAEWVKAIRELEAAMGDGIKRIMPSELANKSFMQKSLSASRDISAGAVIQREDLAIRRPGLGLQPSWLDRVVGKRASKRIAANSLLDLSCIDWSDI